MQTSKLKMFGKLYFKDMHEIWPELIITVGLTLTILVVMSIKAGNNSDVRNVAFIPAILAMGLAGLLPIISSFKLLSREWNNNTVYLIMSLPVSGTMIIGSKMLVLVTQYILGTVLAGLSGIALLAQALNGSVFSGNVPGLYEIINRYPQVLSYTLAIYVVSMIGIIYLCSSSFLAQIIGALFRKRSGLITAVSFIAILYVVGKIMDLFGNYFNFGQNILNVRTQIGGLDIEIFKALGTASAAYLLVSIIIMAIAITVYNRRIQL